MNIPLVDLRLQYHSIKVEIDQAILKTLEAASFVGGERVELFEKRFAEACGAKHCVGLGNGTDALSLTLKALGIGPGAEVLVPVNTFIATAEAVTMTGARVVLVDVEETTSNMSPQAAEQKITKSTKAIVPVHLYGRPANMTALGELAASYGLIVVEDAAQAHLASHAGRRVGSLGQAACFSFYPGKNLGAYGDGGAVVTDDENLAQMVRKLGNHGRLTKFGHEMEGTNSRLDAIQAAILTVKLGHLESWTEARRDRARLYGEFLNRDLAVLPEDSKDSRHVYHLYVIRTQFRDHLIQALRESGISSGIHYPVPLHLLQAYSYLGHQLGDFPVAERLSTQIVSLPMFPELTPEQVEFVSSKVNATLSRPHRPA